MDDLWDVMERDSKYNRIELPAGFHGNHPAYTAWIREKLTAAMNKGRLTPDDIYKIKKEALLEIEIAFEYWRKTGDNMNDYFKILNQY